VRLETAGAGGPSFRILELLAWRVAVAGALVRDNNACARYPLRPLNPTTTELGSEGVSVSMEDVKPTGSTAALNSAHRSATEGLTLQPRPTVADLHGENHFAQVARKNWLTAKAPKVRPEVVKKELWDELEEIDFAYSSLLVLENLQLLERYLWPGFTDDVSNYHHLLLVLLVNVKRRENLQSWGMHPLPWMR
jgi:hypothetical protein